MRVRMLRWIGGYVEVRDLEMGRVYEIADDRARQFIDNGMAERVADVDEHDLEAASLRTARRRG